jgi:hypothetical protein
MSPKTTTVEFIRSVGTEAGSFTPGQRVDLAEHRAAQWVKNGYCNVVGGEPATAKQEAQPANESPEDSDEPVLSKKAHGHAVKHTSKK